MTANTAPLRSTHFRRPPCNHSGAEEHERGQDERSPGKIEGRAETCVLRIDWGIGSDEEGEGLREECRADHAGHAIDAGDGTLQLALFRTTDMACHERLI